jgi:hypothetical protein
VRLRLCCAAVVCATSTACLTRPTRRGNRHMLQDVILQCETSTKFTREVRPRRVGPKRRGRAHESRSRFVDMNDQWTFQCEIPKRHPLRDETSTDETTPKPDRPRPHLGRNRVLAYGPVTFPHSGVSRMSVSVRLMIQGHSARRVTSRVRQCHQLIKISEIKSEPYTPITRARPMRSDCTVVFRHPGLGLWTSNEY